jgi:hypothetical protein
MALLASAPLSVVTSREDLLSRTAQESLEIAEKCDQIVKTIFQQIFSSELQEYFGISAIALGSYARKQQIKGSSDVDLILLCSRIDPANCPEESLLNSLDAAVGEFGRALAPQFQKLGLLHDSTTVRTRVPGSMRADLENYLHVEKTCGVDGSKLEFKKIAEVLTMALTARPIVGVRSESLTQELQAILEDSKLGQLVKESFKRSISECLGEYRTLAQTELDLKSDLQYGALFSNLAVTCLQLTGTKVCAEVLKIQSELNETQSFSGIMRRIHRTAIAGALQRKEITAKMAEFMSAAHHEGFEQAATKLYGKLDFDVLKALYQSAARTDFLVKKILVWFAAEGAIEGELFKLTAPLSIPLSDPEFWTPGLLAERLREQFFTGVLKLPALDELNGLADHNSYQKFTHLEHAIQAVEVIDRLARGKDPDNRFVELYASLSPELKKALSIAVLLHDSGKKEEIEEGIKDPYYHAEVGAEKARLFAEQNGFAQSEQCLIAQLVKNHLWLKDVSKNAIHIIHETLIQELPVEMRNHDFIKLLTLLTYADGVSTNPKSWTRFRSNHLWEAARCAHQEIDGANPVRDLDIFISTIYDQHSSKLTSIEPEELRTMLQRLPISFRSLPPESVCNFAVLNQEYQGAPIVRFFEHNIASDHADPQNQFKADMLVVAPDRKYLASNIAERLAGRGLSIQSADLYTDSNGVAYNRFTVHSFGMRLPHEVNSIQTQIFERIASEVLEIPKSKITFKEQPIVTLLTPRIGIEENVLSLRVKALDQTGLFLHILSTFNRVGLSLRSCSACPEGPYIEDFFELTVEDGRKGRALKPNERDSLLHAIVQDLVTKRD